ncbi:MAG: hypothetical protein KGJ35_00540 [Patescibacteria group bacterium]|nr:hypothetical protein [Patescibacteria group bacterium]
MLKKILFAFVISAAMLSVASAAQAAAPLSGWAWSSNIGWVSFNSGDSGAGGGPYSVQISTSTAANGDIVGTLTGYAWSNNIGWIQFGGLSGQTVNGQTTSDATVDLTTGIVSGWARAVTAVGRTDGWDGWIELAGANHASGDASGAHGVTYVPSTGQFLGYAWGADVVGWLQFTNVICPSCGGNPVTNYTITASAGTGGTIAPSGAVTIPSGGSQTFTISPSSGYELSSVATDSVAIASLPATAYPNTYTYTFSNVTADHTIHADFASCNGTCGGGNFTVTCSANPTTINTNQFTIANATASESGYSGAFTYTWNDGLGHTVSNNNSTHSFTYSSATANGVPNLPTVTVSDGTNTSVPQSCGSITVNGTGGNNNSGIPTLWQHNTTQPNSTSTTLTYHVRTNGNITLDYNWSSSVYNTCVLNQISVAPMDLTSWLNTVLTPDNINSAPTLTGLQNGIYKLHLKCALKNSTAIKSSSNPALAWFEQLFGNVAQATNTTYDYSNPVEIDVSGSTIHEN